MSDSIFFVTAQKIWSSVLQFEVALLFWRLMFIFLIYFFGYLKIRHSTFQELALETIRNRQTKEKQ